MFIDIVMPKNNEKAFLEMATKLGIGLCFLYKESKPNCGTFQKKEGIITALVNNCQITFDPEVPALIPLNGMVGISTRGNARCTARNIRIFRKSNNEVIAASLATDPYGLHSPSDFSSFLMCLGMTPGEAKMALSRFAIICRGNI